MRSLINEYKSECKKILNDKKYIIAIIVTAILGYGYFITHVTIGMDDTCLDRYYADLFETNIIGMVGRWGSYFLYRILNITSFTPFWLEVLTIITYCITAMIIVAFINRNFETKGNSIGIVFSCIYISYSLINEALIFQPSNFALIIGNLLTVISIILIYEGYISKSRKSFYLIPTLFLALGISMYEACCQTFLVGALFCTSYNLINKKTNKKNMFKYLYIVGIILVCSIVLNYLILYLLYFIGVPNELDSMLGEKQINWSKIGLHQGIIAIFNIIEYYTVKNLQYFPVLEFVVATVIGMILAIYYAIKNKDTNIFNIYIFMVFSNFALAILQCGNILYRTCTSWGLFVAGIFAIAYSILIRKKQLIKIATFLVVLVVLWQTKDLNQWFYNEYLRYQKDLKTAYQIAEDIKKEVEDISKPIVFVGIPEKGFFGTSQKGTQSNGLYVVWWGQKAFNDNSYELIKFINSLGYYYKKPTDEQWENGKQLSKDMSSYPKDGYIKEFEDVVVIKFRDI